MGNDFAHGTHHEAQKSTSTTLPLVSGSLPSSFCTTRSGNGSPTFNGACAANALMPSNAASAAKQDQRRSTSSVFIKPLGVDPRRVGCDGTGGAGVSLDELQ